MTEQESPDDGLRLLRDSAAAFAAGTRGSARVRALRDGGAGYDRAVWQEMATLGWAGLLIAEDDGGVGLGLAEACAVATELGKTLHPEPFVPCAVLAATVIAASDNAALKARLSTALIDGSLIAALAWQDDTLSAFAPITARASAHGAGVRLDGVKRFVRPGAADGYIVAAQAERGLGLYWVDAGAAGLTVTLERASDGVMLARLQCDGVALGAAEVLVAPARGAAALALAIDRALLVVSAELCGLMSSMLDTTLDYLRTRVQFDKVIGSFQALQHRAVDLYLQQEVAAAALEDVLTHWQEDDAAVRGAAAARIKARCGDAAQKIARQSVQLHGAIAITDAYDLGLYLKRVLALSAWLGNAAEQRQRFARLTGLIEADGACA